MNKLFLVYSFALFCWYVYSTLIILPAIKSSTPKLLFAAYIAVNLLTLLIVTLAVVTRNNYMWQYITVGITFPMICWYMIYSFVDATNPANSPFQKWEYTIVDVATFTYFLYFDFMVLAHTITNTTTSFTSKYIAFS